MLRLGQLLYQERIRQNLTIEQIASETKIKVLFLQAIEKGEYGVLPSPAYAKGFVKNYSDYLGLPENETSALFRREFDEKKAMKVLPDGMLKTKEFPIKRIRIQQSIILALTFLVTLFAYLLFQYSSLFIAPKLSVSYPKQDSTTAQEVTVIGNTDSNATVIINNESVVIDDKGRFSKKLSLFSGKTIITIKATSRLGKETILKREILVK